MQSATTDSRVISRHMNDNDPTLFDDAQPADETNREYSETIVFDDGTTLIGADLFKPIEVSNVPDDADIADSAIAEY